MPTELAFAKCPHCRRQVPVSPFAGRWRVSCPCGCMDSVKQTAITWVPLERAQTFRNLVNIEYAASREVDPREAFYRELSLDEPVAQEVG